MDRPRRPLHSEDKYIYPYETGREYLKLVGVIVGVLLLSLILTFGRGWDIKYLWTDFIAIIFISSAAYKIFRLEIFSEIFKTFDVVARRWQIWSYLLPFVELALGAGYLLSNGSAILYVATIIVMVLAIYSFIHQPNNKSHIQYACLDRTIRLPLATLDLIEGILVLILTVVVVFIYG